MIEMATALRQARLHICKRLGASERKPLNLARLAGFEPTTPWFVAKYSIQLSYSRCKDGNYSMIFIGKANSVMLSDSFMKIGAVFQGAL